MTQYSTDYLLLKRLDDWNIRNYDWSRENIKSENNNIRAHAYYILSHFYSIGWMVKQNKYMEDIYLNQSANLNHAGACHSLAQHYTNDKLDLAYEYVMKGLNAEDFEINVNEFVNYNQSSFKNQLKYLKEVLDFAKRKR